MAHHGWKSDCKVYVGGLRDDANRYDLEDAFAKIGKVANVWIARKPPGFGFVEMEDPRDAEDAVKELDGARICGSKVRVEMSRGGGPGGRGGRGGGGGDYDRGRRDRSRSRSRSGGNRRRRSPSYRSMSRGRGNRDRSRSRS